MSPNAKEMVAKWLPWVMIVFGTLGLLAVMSMLKFAFGFMARCIWRGIGVQFYHVDKCLFGIAVGVLRYTGPT
jgi:hypothetical protein